MLQVKFRNSKRSLLYFAVLCVLLVIFIANEPSKLFSTPHSLVVESAEGQLLGAHIAADTQWRFPTTDSLPSKYKLAVTLFEDKRFYEHHGVDLLAFCRAIWQNVHSASVVSGGSTITMQLVRLSRNNPRRTILEKLSELCRAWRLELYYSKDEILRHYASNAPFGGNIVGIETAAWRYYGLTPHLLTWAETATLAVLPNSPALIHPGRNRDDLLAKRNRLLLKMYNQKCFDKESYELALDEELPQAPKAFPRLSPHLLHRFTNNSHDYPQKIKTSISAKLQAKVNKLIDQHHQQLVKNQVHNLAVLILDTQTGQVKSYVGNYTDLRDSYNGYQVDMITANRSTGSILKPFLYAAMLSEGELLPHSLVPDVPIYIGSFAPKNYNLGYDGAVPASRALARSLNIPAVHLLRSYSVPKFYNTLQKAGMRSLTYPSGHYGLSLILGGAEGSLWDICGMYAAMGRSLLNYQMRNAQYSQADYTAPILLQAGNTPASNTSANLTEGSVFSASGIWFTFQAMLEVERPGEENNWRLFSSSQKIAWKTGTSFGFRDAWAIGVTPNYVVGVWVGNADGEGRPGIVGIHAAAPLLFDVFDVLPHTNTWFEKPHDDLLQANTCVESGFLAGPNCPDTEKTDIPAKGERSNSCPYHQLIHLDKTERYRVSSHCESPENIITRPFFVLPPLMEWYYKSKNANYKTLPPLRSDCASNAQKTMQFIYPQANMQIYVPRGLEGTRKEVVFEAAHRTRESTIFWYIDEQYIGNSKHFHQISLNPTTGKHVLTIVDTEGNTEQLNFEILTKNE